MATLTNASNGDVVFPEPSEMWLLQFSRCCECFCWSGAQCTTSGNHIMLHVGHGCVLLPERHGEGVLRAPALRSLRRASAQMGYEEPDTTELWFDMFSSKGEYEPNHGVLCYINELCFDWGGVEGGVWREGGGEGRKKEGKDQGVSYAWAVTEGTPRPRRAWTPWYMCESLGLRKNTVTFVSFFTSASSLLQLWLRVITSVWTLATVLNFRQDQVEGNVTHRKEGQTCGSARNQLWALSKSLAQCMPQFSDLYVEIRMSNPTRGCECRMRPYMGKYFGKQKHLTYTTCSWEWAWNKRKMSWSQSWFTNLRKWNLDSNQGP